MMKRKIYNPAHIIILIIITIIISITMIIIEKASHFIMNKAFNQAKGNLK